MTNESSQRVQTCGNPLIDGNIATFVWLGDQAPTLVGDFTDWERGLTFEYRQYPAGQNYPAWRDEVRRGLEFLLSPAHLS